jgi:hypothetical protein
MEDHIPALAYHYGRSNNMDAGIQYLTHSGRQKLMEARKPIYAIKLKKFIP